MQFVQMATTTSPHRCVLESRRLLYHRSCREQSDLMLTVNITFVFVHIHSQLRGNHQDDCRPSSGSLPGTEAKWV